MDESIITRNKVWDSFLQRWPIERLVDLTLEEYTNPDDQDCFVYWLEVKTESLGSIWGGSAFKFGIYARKDITEKTSGGGRHFDEKYAWYAKYGETQGEAFAHVKEILIQIAKASRAGELDVVDHADLGQAVKWKIAFLYQDRSNPHVLPILKTAYLQAAAGIKDRSSSVLQRELMKNSVGRNIFEYVDEVMANVQSKTSKETTDKATKPHIDHPETAPTTKMANRVKQPPLNLILYGPPGTGKTYATIEATLEILSPNFLKSNCEDRIALKSHFDSLMRAGHVRFVTFHQSFSYEDFVEGLRAENGDDGQLRYEVVDGVFKSLCDAAAAKITKQSEAPFDISDRRIWKMSLGNTLGDDSYIFDECIEHGYALLGYGESIDFSECKNRDEVLKCFQASGHDVGKDAYAVTAVSTFILKIKQGDLIVVSEGNTKFRAIGQFIGDYKSIQRDDQGDEYGQFRAVKWLRVYRPALPYDQLMNNKFSQMTLYELRPGSVDMAKLTALLNAQVPVDGDGSTGSIFQPGEKYGSNYRVVSATSDIVELEKPNGKLLSVGMNLLRTLADYVREGRISIDDINKKQVFKKVPETMLDPYIVNGYNNILPLLVERLTGEKVATSSDNSLAEDRNSKVLIIDEINRGNISRVFGELITLIEPSKRSGMPEALEVTLPYSKDRFSVPANLYLIGTMNTADRSLAGLDIALRRRFSFCEMPPRPDLLDPITVSGVNAGSLLRVMNERIELLLDRDHCIGHAYFMSLLHNPTMNELGHVFQMNILPLLQEYFFEDWQRIQWVLNDHRKLAEHRFIRNPECDLAKLFGEGVSVNDQSQRWTINEDAFSSPEAYAGVIAVPGV